MQPDGEASNNEVFAENYNIALNIMHECFDPVEEPQTIRDIIKMLFSVKSKRFLTQIIINPSFLFLE